MLWLQTLLFACAPSDIGANEDGLGHPRSLLADCVQMDAYGMAWHYDGNGHYSEAYWQGGSRFQVMELDTLGRPFRMTAGSPADAAERRVDYRQDYAYVGETWMLASVVDQLINSGEVKRSHYTWARGAYLVEGDGPCVRYVELGAGIRPSMSQWICGGEVDSETHYTWSETRLLEVRTETVDEARYDAWTRYSYGPDERLLSTESQLTSEDPELEAFEDYDSYTWDCQS